MKFDVVIIGAGPSGLALACTLAKTKLKIAIIEKSSRNKFSKPKNDGRDIALTHRSINILKKFGILSQLHLIQKLVKQLYIKKEF